MTQDCRCPDSAVVKERPIIFSAPMVKALLDDRKMQTRRIVKPQPPAIVESVYRPFPAEPNNWQGFGSDLIHWYGRCPYGVPGDRLWVRETWQQIQRGRHRDQLAIVDQPMESIGDLRYAADPVNETTPPRWRSPIHMPRWASRITLELTDVRVERVQDISEEDAQAEGFPSYVATGNGQSCEPVGAAYVDGREWYARLWDKINGPGAWERNDWVWALSFRRLEIANR